MDTNSLSAFSPIDELLIRWEELYNQGQFQSPEQLAADSPELVPELAKRIAALRAINNMLAPKPGLSVEGQSLVGLKCGEPHPHIARTLAFNAIARMVEPQFHARGGLGEVLVVHQEELQRRVALKRIRPDKLHPTARRRFVREATITAQLQHPGIVPIYGLGQDEDEPFYTMAFIEGRTLEEEIRQFHRDEARRSDPGRRSVEFRRLLQRFVTVCETIAYAHDQGVVHRDLKPANIMLGPYGETLVMDWGLAKRHAGDGSDPEAPGVFDSLGPSSEDVTATGAVLGTPLYMSPEQAAGQPAGPASDIFSLGVILYAILTGKPPHEASGIAGRDALMRMAKTRFVAPRHRDPNLSPALEAICVKAMAAGLLERYASAGALAEDLTKWLADEPVTAYAEPWAARVRRWIRRHQRQVTGASAATLMAAVGLAALAVEVSASNRRLAVARAEAENERDQAKEVTEFLVSSFRKPDPAQDGSKVTVAELLAGAVKDLDGRPRMAATTRATILSAVGRTYRGLGLVAETVEISEKAFAIRGKELGADHPQTLASKCDLALSHQLAGRLDLAIRLLEQAIDAQSSTLGNFDPVTLATMNKLAFAYQEAGQLDRAISLHERVVYGQRTKPGVDQIDLLESMNDLAIAYDLAGRQDQGIPLHKQVLAALRAKLGDLHPDTLESMNNLAMAYQDMGQFDLAIPLHEQVLKTLRATIGERHPATLSALNNLGLAFWNVGQPDRAAPLHEEALAVSRIKLGEDHPITLFTMSNLALDYQDDGQLDRAIPLFERTYQFRHTKLGADHPDTLTALNNVAMAYYDAGWLDRAIPLLEQALDAVRSKLGEEHPDTLGSRDNLAAAYRRAGQYDRAIPMHESVLRAQRAKRGENHPDTLATQRNLALAYESAGRHGDAELLFRNTVEAAGRARPRNDRFYSDLLLMLGRALIRQQKYAEAVPDLRECLEIKEKLQPKDWSTANGRTLLGEALSGQKAFGEAEALLLAGQKALSNGRNKIRPLDRDEVLRDANLRLVRLYEAWDKPAEARKWRKSLLPAPPAQPTKTFHSPKD